MINIGKILKRAWHILWNYRVLWIFGILLALTGGGAGGSNGGSSASRYQFNGNETSLWLNQSTDPSVQELNRWLEVNVFPLFTHPEQNIATFVWIGLGLLLFILVVAALFGLIRYPAETAVIRMVDEYEQTGNKVGFKAGWKMGWNRRAFRLWVIDLVISLPAVMLFAVLGTMGWLAYLSVRNGTQATIAVSIISAIGCVFLFIFAFIVLVVLLGLLRQFFVRVAALEGTGIGESFRRGWAMFKMNWKSAALMWLVMVGVGIGVAIAGLIVFFLLIPAYLVLILPAAIVGAIPGLIAYGITNIFATGPLTWIVGILAALPLFLMVLFAPVAFLSGLYKIFESNVWTLTYREIKALENIGPADLQVPAP